MKEYQAFGINAKIERLIQIENKNDNNNNTMLALKW